MTPTQQQPDREGGELVERLRTTDWSGKADGKPCDRGTTCWHRNPDGPEAATHIEDLTRRLAEAERKNEELLAQWNDCEERLGSANALVRLIGAQLDAANGQVEVLRQVNGDP